MAEYLIHIVSLFLIYLILAQSFNVSFGLGGFFHLAHVGVFAIGAYTAALLSVDHGYSFSSNLFLGVFFSSLFAVPLTLISLRLSSDQFAIGSLAFGALILALLQNWKSLTNGVLGVPGIPRPTLLNYEFVDSLDFMLLCLFITSIWLFLLWLIFKSAFARRLRALQEFVESAESLGIRVKRTRALSFFISSIGAGLSGVLFAYFSSYIDPSSFRLDEMILIMTMVIVGKPGLFWGCVISTFGLIALPEALRFVYLPPGVLGPLRQLIYAAILFVTIYLFRRSLFVEARRI